MYTSVVTGGKRIRRSVMNHALSVKAFCRSKSMEIRTLLLIFHWVTILGAKMNFAGKSNPLHFVRASVMALTSRTVSDVPLRRVYSSSLSPGKRWYSLSSQLIGRKVSQFVKGKFFEEFPSEICRVRVSDLWRENGERVPKLWFAEKTKTMDEGYAITLFGLCGGLIKQSSSTSDGFLSSSGFKRVVEVVNNFDFDHECDGLSTVRGSRTNDQTPKSKRIAFLEGELMFYRGKVKEIETSIAAAAFETPPNTPALATGQGQVVDDEARYFPLRSIENIISSSSLGPIKKKRQLKSACSNALVELKDTCNCSHGSLGSILGYGFIYGSEEEQQFVKSAIAQAVEIVANSKGVRFAAELALTSELKTKQEALMRVPDWVQLYVKLEVKLPDNGWQTILNFLNLGRSGVCFLVIL